jgi:hypothetical protein
MPAHKRAMPSIDANIGQTVADSLFAYEQLLDQALSAGARYTANLSDARIQTRSSAVLGSEVFSHVTESLARIGEARAALVASHTALDVVRRQAGLGAVAEGPFWDKSKPAGLAAVPATMAASKVA